MAVVTAETEGAVATSNHAPTKTQESAPVPISMFRNLKPDDVLLGEHDARRSIASRLVWAYLLLILLSAVVPICLYLVGPSTVSTARIEAIRSISGLAAAGISSLTGLLGFVLGYYFKSEERSRS
jgi:hypothetical protein